MDGRSRQNPAYRPTNGEPRTRGALPFVRAVCLAAAGALWLAPSSDATAISDLALLRRYAPVLRYDTHERYRATAVEALTTRALAGGQPEDRVALRQRPGAPDVAYGRVVRARSGRTWLEYWFLYAANPQDRGIVRTGRHEGDWEVVALALRGGRPELAVFAQHHWAEACAATRIEHLRNAPVVYVANGSHASYPHAGEHGRPWPDPDDEADGRGVTARPRVERVTGAAPGWVRWPGRWGRSEASWVPGEKSSPRGPAFQAEGPWADPERYLARARACESGAPALPAPVL